MKITELWVQDCRNITEQTLLPDEYLTVITGLNGEGKTNLLECIWLLTGSKSFRGAKDYELVRRGQEFGHIRGKIETDGQEKNIELAIAGKESGKRGRNAKINGVAFGQATAIAGVFTAVVFHPGHLSLVKSGPDGRRKFIDAALCQLYPGYVGILRRYSRALIQKNALLKQYYQTPNADMLLDTFDETLALTGEEITGRRVEYLRMAGPLAQKTYAELSGGREALEVTYVPSVEKGNLLALLHNNRKVDIKAGFCTAGPHREDFEVLINETSARAFGSQGQQRSAVLSLKLAEAGCAKQVTGQHPVLLLDDVLSELDEGRQTFLLSRMQGKQSILTACDSSAFARTQGLLLEVSGGKIISQKANMV